MDSKVIKAVVRRVPILMVNFQSPSAGMGGCVSARCTDALLVGDNLSTQVSPFLGFNGECTVAPGTSD